MAGTGILESLSILKNVHLLRFAPAWLAVNAVLGLWLTHAVLQAAEDDATGQLLAAGFTGGQIGNGMGLFGLLFGAGMLFWSLQLGPDQENDDNADGNGRRRDRRCVPFLH